MDIDAISFGKLSESVLAKVAEFAGAAISEKAKTNEVGKAKNFTKARNLKTFHMSVIQIHKMPDFDRLVPKHHASWVTRLRASH